MAKEKTFLHKKYDTEIKQQLKQELNLKTIMAVPHLEKIVINIGLGKAVNDKSLVTEAKKELAIITGQTPIITYAKKSNASFKIREGMPIGVKITLRKEKMYDFLDKLINFALPRIRDFRGLKPTSFDGRGNYTLGVNEIIIFPEIELDKVRLMKGMDITIVTSTSDDQKAFLLLKKFKMPFAKR
ncbi:MAG: 50S ribosomal protein L5 [Candidatus Hepatoplasma scabrum]|nr:MAG: 50S ribosomal protein L5 [Candidatus Hepatoplasma sp.]